MGRVTDLKPAPAVEPLDCASSSLSRIGVVEGDLAADSGFGLEQIPLAAGTGEDRGHQLLADRVERRIGDLGEELLEVVEERLGPVGQNRQRRVGAHRPDRLFAIGSHRRREYT